MKPYHAILRVSSFTIVLIMLLTSTLSAVQAEAFLPGGWVKAAGNPIFTHATTGAWDDQWVYGPSVIQDGSTWTRDGTLPVLSPAPLVDISYAWHTFYGGTGRYYDRINSVAADAEGNSYVVGQSSITSWNGPAGQQPLHAHTSGSNPNFFILKLNSAGEYQWHTFYGSVSGGDLPFDIALDSVGNVYVLGTSNSTWGTPLHAHTGISQDYRSNLFVMKLNNAGAYQWHTFYEQGRSQVTSGGRKLAVDASGNAYVATVANYTWNGPAGQLPLHMHSGPAGGNGNSNMLILKLNTNGAYQWHTFYGSLPDPDYGGGNYAWDIAVDASGNAYVAGGGMSWGSPLHANSGLTDIIVLKLNTNGAYQWHTYYGVADPLVSDEAQGISLDNNGYIYVTGIGGPFLGSSGEQPLHSFGIGAENYTDTFVLKLTTSGSYVWHTWYGSLKEESNLSNKAITDSKGNVYIIGRDEVEGWNGPDGQAPLRPFIAKDYFAMKLNGSGAYQWHMFFYDPDTYAFGLAVDAQDNLIVAGCSPATWNGPDGQPPLRAYPGCGFVAKYSADVFSLTTLSQYAAAEDGAQFTLTVTGKKFLDGAEVQWNGSALATTFVNSSTLTALVPANKIVDPGAYAVHVVNPAPEAATSNARYVFVTPTGASVSSQGSGTSSTAQGSPTTSAYGITASGAGIGTVVVARYSANPGGAVSFANNTGAYTDVHVAPGSAFTSLTIINCALNGGNLAYWWNGSSWMGASNQSYDSETHCITISITGSTSPSLNDLTGTPFATGFSGSSIYLPLVVRGQ